MKAILATLLLMTLIGCGGKASTVPTIQEDIFHWDATEPAHWVHTNVPVQGDLHIIEENGMRMFQQWNGTQWVIVGPVPEPAGIHDAPSYCPDNSEFVEDCNGN